MQITNIQEAGANNLMMWAISNGADIKEDEQLQSLINDETHYLVTLSDVNFFELFRITQMYRDKVRILSEKKAAVPLRKELITLFKGSYCPNPDDPETKAPFYEPVEHVIENFINMALQMGVDSDIIKPSAIRLFLPMISRKFDIQIPVAFIDLIQSLTPDEAGRIFTTEYPGTLQEVIDTELNGFKTQLQLGFIKGTSIIRYHKRYDQYLRLTRHAPLKNCKTDKLYKFGILGFFKYDEISRSEVRCSLFNPNPEVIGTSLKKLSRLNTPLHVDFAIQLPIQYMQILENSFDRDVLNVAYESSMANIIDEGINYNDFVTQEFIDENDPEGERKIEKYNNSIDAYRVRIAEANQLLLNLIPVLMGEGEDNDVDVTSVFAMLPSIYSTKAVVTINLEHAKKYIGHSDALISEMFSEMLDMANDVVADINKSKNK